MPFFLLHEYISVGIKYLNKISTVSRLLHENNRLDIGLHDKF